MKKKRDIMIAETKTEHSTQYIRMRGRGGVVKNKKEFFKKVLDR